MAYLLPGSFLVLVVLLTAIVFALDRIAQALETLQRDLRRCYEPPAPPVVNTGLVPYARRCGHAGPFDGLTCDLLQGHTAPHRGYRPGGESLMWGDPLSSPPDTQGDQK